MGLFLVEKGQLFEKVPLYEPFILSSNPCLSKRTHPNFIEIIQKSNFQKIKIRHQNKKVEISFARLSQTIALKNQ